MTCCLIALAALLLLGTGFGLFLFFQHRRQKRQPEHTLSIPQTLPTGETLANLERRFQRTMESALLGLRLARIYAVLLDQDLIRDYVTDTYLVPQIEARTIENNSSLFRCVAEIEETLDERTFKGNPANTIGAHLRSEFGKRGLDWPKHPYAWKQYFIKHHADLLFEQHPG